MPNKTILQLTGRPSPHYGAKELYFRELDRVCHQRGYQCILQYESLPQSSAYLRDLEEIGVKIIILPTHNNPFWVIPKLTALIFSTRPEIVETHTVNRYVRLATPVIARMLGARKSFAFLRNLSYQSTFGLRRFMYNNRYDHVFAVSNAVADDLMNCGVTPEIVSTHYWGVIGRRERSEQLRFQFRKEFGIPEQAVVIGIIAFDTAFKGLPILLNAFAKIVPHHPQVHLLLVGVEPDKSALPRQVAELGILNYIHWAGVRDHGWQLLNAVDIYVQSSMYLEGLPIAVIEAMALMLPVVGTRLSGIPEAVIDGETGYLAEPGSVDSLFVALERMLREPLKWKVMGGAGYRRYLNMFDGNKSVEILAEKYFE